MPERIQPSYRPQTGRSTVSGLWLSAIAGRWSVVISEGLRRIETFRPEIVEPDDLQPFDLADAIAEHRDAVPFGSRDDPDLQSRMRPTWPVVVIPRNADCG